MNELDLLEAEAVYILREVFAQFRKPVLLFSGGKDSLLLLHLSRKAFYPNRAPFPVLHIDTGHNFAETLAFRDQTIAEFGSELIVRSVEDSIRAGRAQEEVGLQRSRNSQQTVTLLDAISEFGFDCAIGGGRRDEEKARAKERIFSFRDEFGGWDPRQQRPELWTCLNGRLKHGQSIRAFPLSDWTELDVWQYIQREKIEVPSLYFSHERECFLRKGILWPLSEFVTLQAGESVETRRIRFRTVGDMTCTAAMESEAGSVEEIVQELLLSKRSERSSRLDDKRSESAMEDRKRAGYF